MLRSRSCSPAMAQNLKSVSPEHLLAKAKRVKLEKIRRVLSRRTLCSERTSKRRPSMCANTFGSGSAVLNMFASIGGRRLAGNG